MSTTHTRVPVETNVKIKEIARELTVIQKKDVSIPETIKRAFNIPNLKDVLKVDAEKKRRINGR